MVQVEIAERNGFYLRWGVSSTGSRYTRGAMPLRPAFDEYGRDADPLDELPARPVVLAAPVAAPNVLGHRAPRPIVSGRTVSAGAFDVQHAHPACPAALFETREVG
jgi:hypothetical protein